MPKPATTAEDADILRSAAELLESHNAWTQCGHLAIDSSGNSVSTQDARACSFCLMGAVARFSPMESDDWEKMPAVISLAETICPGLFDEKEPHEDALIEVIGGFNDAHGTTLQMAVDALRETASRIEASPPVQTANEWIAKGCPVEDETRAT